MINWNKLTEDVERVQNRRSGPSMNENELAQSLKKTMEWYDFYRNALHTLDRDQVSQVLRVFISYVTEDRILDLSEDFHQKANIERKIG